MPIRNANYRMQLAGMIAIENGIHDGTLLSTDEKVLREAAIKIWSAMWLAGPTIVSDEARGGGDGQSGKESS